MPPKHASSSAGAGKRLPPTHFLCIPLVTGPSVGRWRASLDAFRADVTGIGAGNGAGAGAGQVLSSSSDTGALVTLPPRPPTAPLLPEQAIRPLHSIHLTLGVMSLDDPDKIDRAKTALQDLDVRGLLSEAAKSAVGGDGEGAVSDAADAEKAKEQLGGTSDSNGDEPPTSPGAAPLVLSFRSLEPMQSASSTSVLYVPPRDETSRLEPFCRALKAHFTSLSLLEPDGRPLRLHATVLNTLQARSKLRQQQQQRRKKKRLPPGWGRPDRPSDAKEGEKEKEGDAQEEEETEAVDRNGRLDARWLLERWKHVVWAHDVRVDRLAICEMGAKLDGSDGQVRYREIASVPLP